MFECIFIALCTGHQELLVVLTDGGRPSSGV